MSRRAIVTLVLATLLTLALAACSGGNASSAPSTAASAAPPAASPTAASICEETTDPGDVTASIKDFSFDPADITAKVGQVIAFSNTGAAPHTVTLDDGSCTTPNINAGAADGIVFNVAGSYPFHCAIHAQMKGTIVVSE
jgi:plastocyanin